MSLLRRKKKRRAQSRGGLQQLGRGNIEDYVSGLAWNADGTLLACSGSTEGQLFLMSADGKPLHCVKAHKDGVMDLAWQPTGSRIVTGGQDGFGRLWDAADLTDPIAELPTDGMWAEHVHWSGDGRWCAVAAGRKVHVFDADGSPVWTTPQHGGTVDAIAFAHSGTRLATACHGALHLWDVQEQCALKAHEVSTAFASLAWSPDDSILAAGCHDKSVYFWRLEVADHPSFMRGYPRKPTALSWTHDGARLATAGSEAISVWMFEGEGPEGTAPTRLERHDRNVTSLAAASKTHRLASGGADGLAILWVPTLDGMKPRVVDLGEKVSKVVFSPDDSVMTVGTAKGTVASYKVGG